MRLRQPLAVGVLASAVALVGGCTPSPIQQASISDGQLGLQGAYVQVSISLTCQHGWNVAFGDAHVAQADEGRLAQGFGSFENDFPGLPCTGSRQTFSVTVFNGSPWVFRRGDAAADGDVAVFNESTGELAQKTIAPRTIQIRAADSQLAPAVRTQPTRDPRYTET
jgi:hypothetical protein